MKKSNASHGIKNQAQMLRNAKHKMRNDELAQRRNMLNDLESLKDGFMNEKKEKANKVKED